MSVRDMICLFMRIDSFLNLPLVFIHPKGNDPFPLSGQGVLIELVQAPEHVIDAMT